jgi:YegS/Rv2252/BmrU family lipid kinase
VVLTGHPRHAAELTDAALADGCERVVAVGGDGTMNEIAGRLVGTPAVLGLVPCGSGDGLGRHLGLHGSVARALGVLTDGRPRTIDTGVADGRPFINAAGIGFEAEIADRFNRLPRRGFLRYLSTSLAAFRTWRPQDGTVTGDGAGGRIRFFTLAVMNGTQWGNSARIAPGARIDDGRLDLCVVPPVSWQTALPLAVRLFRGTLGDGRGLLTRQSRRFVIERAAPGLLHTDGEVHPAGTRIEFEIRPASLRVMCPR